MTRSDKEDSPSRTMGTAGYLVGCNGSIRRLITLQVLLSAAHDVAEVHDDERSASMFEKVMFNDEVLINTDTDRLKVWPIEVDQEAFINVISLSDLQSGVPTLEGEDTLHSCFQYFRDQIDEWVSQGKLSPVKYLDVLVTTMVTAESVERSVGC